MFEVGIGGSFFDAVLHWHFCREACEVKTFVSCVQEAVMD
jgi:hypothetical protein